MNVQIHGVQSVNLEELVAKIVHSVGSRRML